MATRVVTSQNLIYCVKCVTMTGTTCIGLHAVSTSLLFDPNKYTNFFNVYAPTGMGVSFRSRGDMLFYNNLKGASEGIPLEEFKNSVCRPAIAADGEYYCTVSRAKMKTFLIDNSISLSKEQIEQLTEDAPG